VLELADILREGGQAYRQVHGARMLPSHLRAMRAIEDCRTAALGGHLRACDHCGQRQYAYHSCRNRHCPKCHRDQTQRWLEHTRAQLLPCPYFLVTFTLPAELRALARSHQKVVYGLLMRSAAEALLKLTADPDYLGARPGILAVPHTWTRAMTFHPHVQILVTAGGWRDGHAPGWVPSKRPDFLVPGRALSIVFRAKLRDALRHAGLVHHIPNEVWRKDWVVHLQHAGSGDKVLEYLARYVFRIALVNSRLERFDNGQVTFRFRDARSGRTKHCTLATAAFIARFLQHVLPRGFPKVRHSGLFSPSRKPVLEQARATLVGSSAKALRTPSVDADAPALVIETVPADKRTRCSACGLGVMHVIDIPRRWSPPP